MLGERDVGHRVVVRRHVGILEGRPRFTDALGDLLEVTETHLTLRTTDGTLRIPRDQVHRSKRVPPTRRPDADAVAALERAANEAWPAPVQENLGGWLLRAADGWTARGNSALPLGDPGRPIGEAIEEVRRWYAERGLPALITVPLPLARPVAAVLSRRGWTPRPPVLVQTCALAPLLAATDPTTPDAASANAFEVELATEPPTRWLHRIAERRGQPPPGGRHLLTAVPQVRFAGVYADGRAADGELLALARGTITGAGRWLGLTLIEVAPAARRRGLARRMIGALADWAAQAGATDVFLQVEQENAPAVALYRRLGFTTHHTYRTWSAPTGDT